LTMSQAWERRRATLMIFATLSLQSLKCIGEKTYRSTLEKHFRSMEGMLSCPYIRLAKGVFPLKSDKNLLQMCDIVLSNLTRTVGIYLCNYHKKSIGCQYLNSGILTICQQDEVNEHDKLIKKYFE